MTQAIARDANRHRVVRPAIVRPLISPAAFQRSVANRAAHPEAQEPIWRQQAGSCQCQRAGEKIVPASGRIMHEQDGPARSAAPRHCRCSMLLLPAGCHQTSLVTGAASLRQHQFGMPPHSVDVVMPSATDQGCSPPRLNSRRLLEPIGTTPPAEAEANFRAIQEADPMAMQPTVVSLRQTRRGSVPGENRQARSSVMAWQRDGLPWVENCTTRPALRSAGQAPRQRRQRAQRKWHCHRKALHEHFHQAHGR